VLTDGVLRLLQAIGAMPTNVGNIVGNGVPMPLLPSRRGAVGRCERIRLVRFPWTFRGLSRRLVLFYTARST
jgi:hypothetical protein